MKVTSVNENINQNKRTLCHIDVQRNNEFGISKDKIGMTNQMKVVSFKGGSNFSKRLWFQFRKISDYMKQPSEMTNALIAMIGTGGIAPFAIMCSPKKKNESEQEAKTEKDKKFFQALRQPVSAFLAFAFQVPTTIGIAMGLNHLAYKKHAKLFDDEVLGHLIPDKKYLRKQALNAMDKEAKPELKGEWQEELRIAQDEATIKSELKEKLRKEYEEVKLDISEAELDKLANNKKKQKNFIADKMADAKHNKLLNEKVEELKSKNLTIKDSDLVTENYQKLAQERYKNEFASLKKEANLNWFDKFINTMGFSNKKLNKLSKQTKELAQEKGLALIKQDIAEGKIPDVLNNKDARLKNFIENRIDKAKKLYANKIFWLTLGTNLFMVAISCVALNWLHPKFADFVDNVKEKRNAHKDSHNQKVEVRA